MKTKEEFNLSEKDGTFLMCKEIQKFIEGKNKNHTFFAFVITPEELKGQLKIGDFYG